MFGNIPLFWDRYHTLILSGIKTTLIISALSVVIGIIGGFIFGYLRTLHISRKDNKFVVIGKKSIYWILEAYVSIFRFTPFISQAFFFYYVFFANVEGAVLIGTIVLSLNLIAYMTVVFEGGIKNIDEGQYKAGRSLGLSHTKTFTSIILPQAFRAIIAPTSNEIVNTIKATAVLSVITVADLMYQIRTGTANGYDMAAGYSIAIIIYFIICLGFTLALKGVAKLVERGGW